MRAGIVAAALVLVPAAAPAAAADLFVGYSRLRTGGDDVHGAALSFSPLFGERLGLAVEATGISGRVEGEEVREMGLAAGPVLAPWRGRRLSPFLHAKGGLAWSRRQVQVFGVAIGSEGVCDGSCPGRLGVVAEGGAGLDVRLGARWLLRLPEVDYRRTFLEGGDTEALRVSAGIVFRWGR